MRRLHSTAVVLAGAGLLAAAGLSAAQGTIAPEAQRVMAFRGYSAVAPENTLAALRAAVLAGVPRVWVDVRTTSDGMPVLLADADLDRTTNCKGAVADQTSAVVTACDAGSWFDPAFATERVPTLSAALAIPDLQVALNLQDAAPALVLAAVRTAGALDRVTFVTEREDAVTALLAAEPTVHVWLRVASVTAGLTQLAHELGARGLAVDAGPLEAGEIGAAVGQGLDVVVVDVPDERMLFSALDSKATTVVTARVEASVRALSYRFRTYPPAALGRPSVGQQGFVRTLSTGDFNGDHRTDLAIGVPFDDQADEAAGWAGVLLGGLQFPGRLTGASGTERDGQWGGVLAVGDFNADGMDDLAFGLPQRDFSGTDSGAVWLWDGSAGNVGSLSRPIGNQSLPGAHMGAALAVGDINGDTVADLAIGSPDQTVAGLTGAGQVVVMPGLKDSGPVITGALTLDRTSRRPTAMATTTATPIAAVPGDPARGERLGAALAAGDYNGDTFADLAIGVPGTDVGTVRDAGSVLVSYGAADQVTDYPQLERVDELHRDSSAVPGVAERASGFGSVLIAGNFDKDAYDDLVIGVPDATVDGARSAGEVVVLYGADAGFDPARAQVINQGTPLIPGDVESRMRFGAHLAVGDLNGDGYGDLLVGVPDAAGAGLPGVGAVIAMYGGPTGLQPRVSLALSPGLASTGFAAVNRQAFGSALAVGDLNKDGAADIAIGVPGYGENGVAELGALAVAWGYTADLPGVATPTVRPPTQTPVSTLTRTPRPSSTPRPTFTPQPGHEIYLPYGARLHRFAGR